MLRRKRWRARPAAERRGLKISANHARQCGWLATGQTEGETSVARRWQLLQANARNYCLFYLVFVSLFPFDVC